MFTLNCQHIFKITIIILKLLKTKDDRKTREEAEKKQAQDKIQRDLEELRKIVKEREELERKLNADKKKNLIQF
jgi:hypothetical protein